MTEISSRFTVIQNSSTSDQTMKSPRNIIVRMMEYRALADAPEVRRVLLLPDRAEAHRRNLLRSGDSPARPYIDEGIRIIYDELTDVVDELRRQGWLVVDTSALTVAETVETILAADGKIEVKA